MLKLIGQIINRQNNITQISNGENITSEIISGAFDSNSQKSNVEWKKILTPSQFHILREAGTEIPFTGKLNGEKRKGTYFLI